MGPFRRFGTRGGAHLQPSALQLLAACCSFRAWLTYLLASCNTLSFSFPGPKHQKLHGCPPFRLLSRFQPSIVCSLVQTSSKTAVHRQNIKVNSTDSQPASRQLACSAAHSEFSVWLSSSLSFFILSFLRHLSSHRFRFFLTKHRNAVLCFLLSFTSADTAFNKHPPNYFHVLLHDPAIL